MTTTHTRHLSIPQTAAELRAWVQRNHMSIPGAAARLGMCKRSLGYLLAGERDGKPVAVPRVVGLAAVAIEAGLDLKLGAAA